MLLCLSLGAEYNVVGSSLRLALAGLQEELTAKSQNT